MTKFYAVCVFTVRQWLEQFAKQKRTSRSHKTALKYDQMINEFVEFLGSRADLNVCARAEMRTV